MTIISYEFEELQPYKGLAILVDGTAEIVGEWQPADSSVGIRYGHWDYYVEAVTINSTVKGQPDTEIGPEHPLYDLIVKQLLSDPYDIHIRAELRDASEPDPDYYYRD